MSNFWADKAGLDVRKADLWTGREDGAAEAADAFARGLEEGRRTVEAEVAGERVALVALLNAIEGLTPPDPAPVAALMVEAVVRLVEDIVGQAPIDRERLMARATALAALAVEAGQPVLAAHPQDLLLLDADLLDVPLAADASLARGTLQLRATHAAYEDGVAGARERLLAECRRLGLAL